jgi:hypothetical protein
MMSMYQASSILAGLLILGGCTGKDPEKNADDSTAGSDDTGAGGGNNEVWAPLGTGHGWFVDGASDNSVFHLEIEQTRPPKTGEAYYGWISKGGSEPISVGEIVVSGESVIFEADIGINAVTAGYDSFEAWATDNGGSTQEGTLLWKGQVDPIIYASMQNLLIASTQTPDGDGSLRSTENYLEQINDHLQDTLATAANNLTALKAEGESLVNAINGTEEDIDENGSISTYNFQFSLNGSGGYIDLILADITVVSDQVEPTNEIKEFGNYAYDCTQLIEEKADDAAFYAELGAASAAASSALSQLEKSLEAVGYALNGQDGDDEGEDIDLITEGTLECAILYVSEMMRMDVAVP